MCTVELALGYRSMARTPEVSRDLDAQLRRVADGDAEAFAAFYDATCARVFGLISRVLRDPGYSEETTQDVYAQVWRSASDFDPLQGSALAWLMTLARRPAAAGEGLSPVAADGSGAEVGRDGGQCCAVDHRHDSRSGGFDRVGVHHGTRRRVAPANG